MKLKALFFLVFPVLFLGGIFVYQYSKFNNKLLHVVFCNVGQGDGIFVRTPKGQDILIDGGPDDSILSCLSENMPFWDRKIDLLILTHPHLDHLQGLVAVFKNYDVSYFATENIKSDTQSYKEFVKYVRNEKSKVKYLYRKDRINIQDNLKIIFLWPDKESLKNITEEKGDKEISSLVSLLSYGSFDLLLTGDNQVEELNIALESLPASSVEVLQVPHHGSKTGLNSMLLDQIDPEMAIISVGENNKYKHPSKKVLDLLLEKKIKYLRTDKNGNIKIVSDGLEWRTVY